MNEQKRNENAAALLKEMEATAAQMRELIAAMPPHDLLGYIYSQRMMMALTASGAGSKAGANEQSDLINESQFLLEYVHAVLASTAAPASMVFDESRYAELSELGTKLRGQASHFAMATSADSKNGVFGPDTADIEFHAKSTWVVMRGNRYQVLEEEFYRYVLAPHNEVLKEVYGVDAIDIAKGFQAMTDATRTGYADAGMEMKRQFEAAQAFAAAQGKTLKDSMGIWVAADAERSEAARLAMDDMFRGGITNVSRHTKLPSLLLADLAYRRGEETEFFAPGDFSGTPYRTLPARKKPLIQLESDYYAVDPCFTRDAGYRALLYNLLQRKPDYKRSFEDRQKSMSEGAFADILTLQLPGATVFQEVYYKDPVSKQWAENDTLVLIEDVLFLVEAKAGAAASIASPALDFGRHAQSVQDLVVKAYKQCERFFNYLNSAEEVPLFRLVGGKHEECGRIRRSDYRVMVPIGLTVESFSPFSAYCKELPQIEPLLGKHAFVSLSIDDLFVLKRFLPTPGVFSHYMEVRQAVAGMRGAHLFDELDHLGAYLKKNRFDQDIADQLKGHKTTMAIWSGMSDVIDRSFEGEDWETRPLPTQKIPNEVRKLLEALDTTRARGWIAAEGHIRDLDGDGRANLAKTLSSIFPSLERFPTRHFTLSGGSKPLFICLQKYGHPADWRKVTEKASAAALAFKASSVTGIVAEVRADGTYVRAQPFEVHVPTARTDANAHIYEDAARMPAPKRVEHLLQSAKSFPTNGGTKKLGRNDPCSCGSGKKYKKCHGR